MTAFVFINTRLRLSLKLFLAAVPAILFAQPLPASTNPATKQITELAQHTLDKKASQSGLLLNAIRTEATVTPPPENLQLSLCDTTPEITISTENHTGSQRLQLQCHSPNSWTIYMRGHIDAYAEVLVSRIPMTRGMQPTPKNTHLEERNISDLKRGYLLDYQQLENMSAARRIRAGEVIIPSMLEPEQIIQRGDRVNLVAGSGNMTKNSGSFLISMPGEAMNNGALHQQIRVRNISSGRIVTGDDRKQNRSTDRVNKSPYATKNTTAEANQ